MAFLSFGIGDGLELKWSTIAPWNWRLFFIAICERLKLVSWGSRMVPHVPRWQISIQWGARGCPAPCSCCSSALADGGGEVCCCHLAWGVTWSYGLQKCSPVDLAGPIQVPGLVVPFFQIKIASVCHVFQFIENILQVMLPSWRSLLIFWMKQILI